MDINQLNNETIEYNKHQYITSTHLVPACLQCSDPVLHGHDCVRMSVAQDVTTKLKTLFHRFPLFQQHRLEPLHSTRKAKLDASIKTSGMIGRDNYKATV